MKAPASLARLLRSAWFIAWCASSLTLLALLTTLAPHLANSAELVRMRNALLLQSHPASYQWPVDKRPADFPVDDTDALVSYREAISKHGLVVDGDDWSTALAIGRHLLVGGKRRSTPIQSNLEQTYSRIVQNGEGYCGDYVDSFTGLAHVAGLSTRPWAFSFDGFGGHGHIFNEVWDRKAGRWIAIDVFNNMYFTDAEGRALSAIELREGLRQGVALRVTRIRADVRGGFAHDDRALAYYRAGLNEWYMWWGTDVFAYDRSPVVRLFGPVSRSAEQLAAIAAGVHPRIRILEVPENEGARAALSGLRWRLLAVVVLVPICLGLSLLLWRDLRRHGLPGRVADAR
jgi:hypothetical protein